jgi:SAM-dependent methyltransferase
MGFLLLDGHWKTKELMWHYEKNIREYIPTLKALLDMGTGGGGFLSLLTPLPPKTYATEAYIPNLPMAKKRLEPLGVTVKQITDDKVLPFEDETFDLVINRHESFWSDEIYRILKPGGRFITQQVGERNNLYLNELIAENKPKPATEWSWTLQNAVGYLRDAGFVIVVEQEQFPREHYYDIGALVFYLKVIQWQIPDFSVEKYREELGQIHNTIEMQGAITPLAHRFYIEAIKA